MLCIMKVMLNVLRQNTLMIKTMHFMLLLKRTPSITLLIAWKFHYTQQSEMWHISTWENDSLMGDHYDCL